MLSDVVKNDSQKRIALTQEQEDLFMNFIKTDKHYCCYYSLQYLMGYSDAGVTMNVYTHATYDHAEATMQKILRPSLPEGERKSG